MATVKYEKPRPLIKRISSLVSVTEKIISYDKDNAYPQRVKEVVRRSSTLKALLSRVVDFVNGEGFQDEALGNIIVNRKGLNGQTLNKVMQITAEPFVWYSSVPMHFNFNMLGQICGINPIPFEYVRYAIKVNGKVVKYAYSSNWERDSLSSNSQNIVFYDKFNPDPAVVLQQIAEAGGIQNYKGQIMYLTPIDGEYPLATFDSVYNDAQVQDDISTFKISSTQNNFLATLLAVYPGEFPDIESKLAWDNLIENKSGVRNAGGIIGIQDKSGTKRAKDLFQEISPVNLDRLYEYTERSVKENIIESECFPPILLGKSPSGLFARGDIEEAYTYANSITRTRRMQLAEVFSYIMRFWETPIETDAYIKEQRYVVDDFANTNAINVNDNLKNMTGQQAYNFARIIKNYGSGKYTRDVAFTLLRGGFGMSDEEINKLLDGIDAAKLEDGAVEKVVNYILNYAL